MGERWGGVGMEEGEGAVYENTGRMWGFFFCVCVWVFWGGGGGDNIILSPHE